MFHHWMSSWNLFARILILIVELRKNIEERTIRYECPKSNIRSSFQVYVWKALRLLSRSRLNVVSKHFGNIENIVKQLDEEKAAEAKQEATVRTLYPTNTKQSREQLQPLQQKPKLLQRRKQKPTQKMHRNLQQLQIQRRSLQLRRMG